jgi:UDP-3-O-[3-hydroxymyristoyl] glucosamine N-acyltransferase
MTELRTITVEELCRLLDVPPPRGLEQRQLSSVSTLSEATETDLAYLVRDNLLAEARASRAGLILVSRRITLEHPAAVPVDNVMEAVVKILRHFHPDPAPRHELDPSARVHETARVGREVTIGANVVIEENVVIGDRTRIEANSFIGRNSKIGADSWFSPNITILHDSVIGNRVRLHPGVVIGADGFRLEMINGRPQKIPQIGHVVIEDDVEIGANSTIDRASLTVTRVGTRTKIDNMVHIGHNVIVGSDCIIVAQVAIGGSARIGRGVMIAGGVGIKDNITIGDGARIGGRSGVQNSLPPRADVMGYPAIPVKDYARFIQFYKRFSTHWTKLKTLLGLPGQEGNDTENDMR